MLNLVVDGRKPDIVCPVCKERIRIEWSGGGAVKSKTIKAMGCCPSCKGHIHFQAEIEVKFSVYGYK